MVYSLPYEQSQPDNGSLIALGVGMSLEASRVSSEAILPPTSNADIVVEDLGNPIISTVNSHRIRYLLYRVALLAALVGIWEVVSVSHLLSSLIASSPSQVATYLYSATMNGSLLSNFWATFEATLIAFTASGLVGTAIGVSIGLLPRVEKIVDPYISALNAMPRIALAPVFVIYFGIGIEAKVALAFSFVVFVFIINARAGIKSADPDILKLSSAFGSSRMDLLIKVLLPTALPSIFAAIRLGIVYSFLGVVTSELIAAKIGLGQLIEEYSGVFKIGNVYGILIVLAVVASILSYAFGQLERYLLRWQESPR